MRASFPRIRSWIAHCNRNHNGCIEAQRLGPLLPTRVVVIGDAPDQLYLMASEGARGHYAAMSYAWGKVSPEPITTTRHTWTKHLHGFSISELPPSLRDGVLTARNLGLRYLWIDRLCIIQDSIADKETEMANMQQIYQNAYLTIVAACASSSAESFLNIRDAHSSVITLPVFCLNPDSVGRDRIREDGSVQLWHKDSSQGCEPLYERAWTLQETFLAPRLLIYSRDCCFFKCLGGHQCDDPAIDWNTYCAKAGLNSTRMMHQGKLTRPSLSAQAPGIHSIINSTSMQANKLPEHFRAWKRIVRDYSMRALSDPMDKLPALSGVVSYMQSEMKDECLAGLWRRHLLREVTWMSKGATRSEVWRAPSWSWMSLDGPLS
ncbi:HET-domain-containing protein, partial [Pseudovirgaria hyperparasitica]